MPNPCKWKSNTGKTILLQISLTDPYLVVTSTWLFDEFFDIYLIESSQVQLNIIIYLYR